MGKTGNNCLVKIFGVAFLGPGIANHDFASAKLTMPGFYGFGPWVFGLFWSFANNGHGSCWLIGWVACLDSSLVMAGLVSLMVKHSK